MSARAQFEPPSPAVRNHPKPVRLAPELLSALNRMAYQIDGSHFHPLWAGRKASGHPPPQPTLGNRMKPSTGPATRLFAGAPLDVVKLVAAGLMAADHVNTIFLGHRPGALWHIGRLVFPLFCFALVCNLQRGASVSKYLEKLLVFAVLSQPIYAAALRDTDANVLFTLAAGIAVAGFLRQQSLAVQHAALGAGVAAIFSPYVQARTGVDFGLAGMLFPAALLLVMDGAKSHAVWLVAVLIGLNWFPPDPWRYAPITTAMVAGVGSLLILALALGFRNYPRFLPRYALHLFYPGHLLLLAGIRAMG